MCTYVQTRCSNIYELVWLIILVGPSCKFKHQVLARNFGFTSRSLSKWLGGKAMTGDGATMIGAAGMIGMIG